MPSNKVLEAKKQVVEELAGKLQTAVSGVLVKYEGITVADDTALRTALRKAGIEYSVMKNTLTGRACDIAGYGEMKEYLSGMTAIAISQDDPIAPAKVIKKYAEKIESFQILAGYLDGAVVDKDTVVALADIPAKEVLIAKFLGSIKSPLYGLAYALQAVVDKDGEAAPAEAATTEEAPAEA